MFAAANCVRVFAPFFVVCVFFLRLCGVEQGVEDKEASEFYLGKRIAYIYKVRALRTDQ